MDEPTAKTRVGLVGAGYVSFHHARALRSLPFIEIVGIADPDEERARKVAKQFDIPHIYASLAEMAAAEPQVIHVLTPPAYHTALVLEALEMGCHVFVEKPMAETVEDCDRMIAKAKERSLVLSVNHSARMEPLVLRALEMVRQGAVGMVLGVDFLRSSDYPAFSGGTKLPPYFGKGSYPFQDLGVHGLYTLEAFLGPVQHADIRYYASGLGDPNLVFDEWRSIVECEHGNGGMYHSWNVRPIQNELIVHGASGVIHIDCLLQTLTVRKTYPVPRPVQRILAAWFNSLQTLWTVTLNTFKFATKRLPPSPGIYTSVVKFHEALRAGQAPPVPAEEGRHMIDLIAKVSREADDDRPRYLAQAPPVNSPRILVTGANGFLGSALLRRLRQTGQPIRVMVRRPAADHNDDPNLQYVYGDLGHSEAVDQAVEGIETVYHVGAAMKGGNFEFQAGTIWGTRNVLAACERHGVKKLVYVSSMTVLDHAGHNADVPVNEKSPYEPHPERRGLYTQTKLEAEKMVLQAVEQGRVNAVILRPGQIYGKGAEKFAPGGVIGIAGRWLVVGDGSHFLPVVFIENVVDALVLAGEKDLPNGAIYQLVDPGGIRQREFVGYAQRAGLPVKPSYVPRWFLYLASIGVEVLGKVLGRGVPLTRYRIRSITPVWPCDCSAAMTELGWKPRVTVEQGMAETYRAE